LKSEFNERLFGGNKNTKFMEFAISILIAVSVIAALYFFPGRENNSNRLENDAKRFARLLVSEIKLYENYKVERGLRNNNLYESLYIEIGEARKKYKMRVPNVELDKYFDDALVEVLADGDKGKLGIK
jgi:hypothetical protein